MEKAQGYVPWINHLTKTPEASHGGGIVANEVYQRHISS